MDTKIIVIACIHNEEGYIGRFLSTCSYFADYIIIHDETAHDNTRSFYSKYPKVIAHCNDGPPMLINRRSFLIEEARKIKCDKRILVVLDADEILSSEVFTSNEWQTVLHASSGTLFYLQWVNLWRNPLKYKFFDQHYYGSFHARIWVDDGVSTIAVFGSGRGHSFHGQVLPAETAQKIIYLHEIVILHYQFTNWDKMESKHRWYRCFEKAEIRKLSTLGIFRMYGYMDTGREPAVSDSPKSWFEGWKTKGIDVTSVSKSPVYFYDIEVLKLFKKYTPQFFTWQDVWRDRVDWNNIIKKAKGLGFMEKDFQLEIPKRGMFPRIILKLGRITGRSKKWLAIERIFFGRSFEYRKNNGE